MKNLVMFLSIMFIGFGQSESASATTKATGLLEQVCQQCHSLNKILSKNKTKTSWRRTVERMRKKMDLKNSSSSDLIRSISDDEEKQIVAYLYTQRGYKGSKSNQAVMRRKKLLEKFTPSNADLETVEERREKLEKKFTTSETIEDRRKRLLKQFKSSETDISPAEAKRQKFREKFPPTKARVVSPGSRTGKSE
jgi:Mn-dependent DtxR family transcriptional regulator